MSLSLSYNEQGSFYLLEPIFLQIAGSAVRLLTNIPHCCTNALDLSQIQCGRSTFQTRLRDIRLVQTVILTTTFPRYRKHLKAKLYLLLCNKITREQITSWGYSPFPPFGPVSRLWIHGGGQEIFAASYLLDNFFIYYTVFITTL